MNDKDSQSIKATVDSDSVQGNSSHIESVLFVPPLENDDDSEDEQEN